MNKHIGNFSRFIVLIATLIVHSGYASELIKYSTKYLPGESIFQRTAVIPMADGFKERTLTIFYDKNAKFVSANEDGKIIPMLASPNLKVDFKALGMGTKKRQGELIAKAIETPMTIEDLNKKLGESDLGVTKETHQ